MALHPTEKMLIQALEQGNIVTLNQLGGLSALEKAKHTLALSPLISDLFSIILQELDNLENDKELAESFILFCLEKIEDELSIQTVINCLELYRPFSKKFEDSCFKILLSEAQNNQKSALTRSWYLEASFRLAIHNAPARRLKLLSYLVDLPLEDEPEYLRHAAKIIGLAYTFWKENDLIPILEQLTENERGADEAFFELGFVSLANALEAESADEAKNKFNQAYQYFENSLKNSEDRCDAEVFCSAIKMLLSLERNDLQENYQINLERLKKAITIYPAWHQSDAGEVWVNARNIELINWQTLAIKLEALSGYLVEPSWFEPIVVIEQALLIIYTASRTIFKRNKLGGLETVIQPNIRANLIEHHGQIYALEKWLERNPSEDLREIGDNLRIQLNNTYEESLGKESGVGINNPSMIAPNQKQELVKQMLDNISNFQTNDISPALETILCNCINLLEQIDDYKNERVRMFFDSVFFQTLRFLEDRMNMTKKHNPRLEYLFESESESKPKEHELQKDYYEFVHGNLARGYVKVEVSDIASGRADVCCSFNSIQFVVEVKREMKNCSFDALSQKYIAQASEYQNTNVKLGFLLVLDLTKERLHGAGSIEDHVKVEIIETEYSRVKRAVVIIRVPGRRKTPSSL
jgi:hypothetical protein